uniref:Uncharacterized protein n=1 Tax=Anguilla anguilla TaxID=7936 RepID=A0A0E9SPW4_ANGAN
MLRVTMAFGRRCYC